MDNKSKRVLKGEVKFKMSLNSEQKEGKATILQNKITVVQGQAGSGKTLLVCQTALDLFFKREIDQIIICRPAVSTEDNGFLPGNIQEKLTPYMQPIYDNLYSLYDPAKIDKMIAEKQIVMSPLGFMRGKTHCNAFIIIDEAQNVTKSQMEMIVTRLGKGSRMVIVGDSAQNDLPKGKVSGFLHLVGLSKKIDGMDVVKLLKNHRDQIIVDIMNAW